jgi:hypothetical protein
LGGFGPILLNGRQYMRNSENKNKSMVSWQSKGRIMIMTAN